MKWISSIFGNKTHKDEHDKKLKHIVLLCAMLILGVFFSVGGTLAFLQEQTTTVTNSFTAGGITYTLNLEVNATAVNHTDSDVTMLTEITPTNTTDLSVGFTAATPQLSGYTFGGWYYESACEDLHTAAPGNTITVAYGDSNDSNDAANKVTITLYAKWSPNNDTPYKVMHYLQNVENDDYTLVETATQELKGTTDTRITPDTKTYEGFQSPDTQTVTINGNGTTVVNYYYDRLSYTVNLQKGTDGISGLSGAGTYRYGTKVTIVASIAEGYTWSGWTGESTLSELSYVFHMPAKDVTYTANTEIINYPITYELNKGTVSGNPVTYTVKNSYVYFK